MTFNKTLFHLCLSLPMLLGSITGSAAHLVVPEKSLMITDLSVVEDPIRTQYVPLASGTDSRAGVWSFGRLMENMAGEQQVSVFVENWLRTWESDQLLNGDVIPARKNIRSLIIDPWKTASGGQTLDMSIAPFRLLAIVNRMDLREVRSESLNINAGEGRFVFGVLDHMGNPLPFTVILEYELLANSNEQVLAWARAWQSLSEAELGTEAFNQRLQFITNRFTGAGIAPEKARGSALNQLRSNDFALRPAWELREFSLDALAGLTPATVKQTTVPEVNNTDRLAAFINANEGSILNGVLRIPVRALAAHAMAPILWTASGIRNPEARHKFALESCNGCHTAETGTAFLHVANRSTGQVSRLSGFLTGTTVPDPDGSGLVFDFNDLERRAVDLSLLLDTPVNVLVNSSLTGRVH